MHVQPVAKQPGTVALGAAVTKAATVAGAVAVAVPVPASDPSTEGEPDSGAVAEEPEAGTSTEYAGAASGSGNGVGDSPEPQVPLDQPHQPPTAVRMHQASIIALEELQVLLNRFITDLQEVSMSSEHALVIFVLGCCFFYSSSYECLRFRKSLFVFIV